MMINFKKSNLDPHLDRVEKPGTSGLNHLWDAPLDNSGFPKGPGSSSGKDGYVLKADIFQYKGGPITQRVKGYTTMKAAQTDCSCQH